MGRLKNVSREAQKAAFANMEKVTKKGIARYSKKPGEKKLKKLPKGGTEDSNAEETKAEEKDY